MWTIIGGGWKRFRLGVTEILWFIQIHLFGLENKFFPRDKTRKRRFFSKETSFYRIRKKFLYESLILWISAGQKNWKRKKRKLHLDGFFFHYFFYLEIFALFSCYNHPPPPTIFFQHLFFIYPYPQSFYFHYLFFKSIFTLEWMILVFFFKILMLPKLLLHA